MSLNGWSSVHCVKDSSVCGEEMLVEIFFVGWNYARRSGVFFFFELVPRREDALSTCKLARQDSTMLTTIAFISCLQTIGLEPNSSLARCQFAAENVFRDASTIHTIKMPEPALSTLCDQGVLKGGRRD